MAIITENLHNQPRSVRALLLASASAHADRPAILTKTEDGVQTYTYRRLRSDVEALAALFTEKGLVGKRLLICGENGYAWALGFLAALTVGAVAVPVNKTLADTLPALCDYTSAAAILYTDALDEAVASLPETVERLPFSAMDALLNEGRNLLDSGAIEPPSELDETAPAALLFASGSGLSPRAVSLSSQNLAFTATRAASALGLTPFDRVLSILPLHNSYALVLGLLAPLSRGAAVAFGEGLRAIVKNMGELKPTTLIASPLIAEALYRKVQKILAGYGKAGTAKISATGFLPTPLAAPIKKQLFPALHRAFGGSLRTIVCSGAPVGAHILKGLAEVGFTVLEGYGLCESASLVALNPKTAPRFGSVGKPLPDVILDVYNKGEDGIGEIRLRSDGVMLGYFENQSATAEALRGAWLYTGDLGYVDAKGYLYITGRKQNLLVGRTGKSVSPEELEVLLMKEPFVREAVVVGFVNEEKRDYDLVAVVYPDVEHLFDVYGENYTLHDAETEVASALERVNAALPAHKRPVCFVLRGTEFEKTGSRKIRRAGVAASVEEEYRKKMQK